jgi:hypothetical protein
MHFPERRKEITKNELDVLLQFNGHSVDKGGEHCNTRVRVKLLGPNVNDKTGVNIDKDKDVFETVQR